MIEAAQAAGLGLGLGVVTGMPLGVVNVAIVDAASAGRIRFATGIGLGGAIADATHAAVAAIGVGQLLLATPDLRRWLAIGAAVLIVAYAVFAWRAKRERRAVTDDSSFARGAITGCVLTLPNPGALAAWGAVAAALWSEASTGPTASTAQALAFGIGVGAGSAIWFAALARWVGRVRSDHPALAVIPRIALVALVAIAGIGVARAI